MKLKQLVVALLGVQLVACAHQPISQDSNLSQKVYQGYENLVGKESYSFDGRTQFQLKTAAKATEKIVNAEQKKAEQLQKQKLLSSVLTQQKIPKEQLKWMQEGIEKGEGAANDISEDKLSNFIQTITGRLFYDYSGVVDLNRGQVAFDSQFGYKARNAEAWLKLPLAIDLRHDKAYADLSGLSPLLTDPKYDGRYVVYDYKNILNELKVDKKAVLEVFKEYMLVNAALAKEQDYQTLPTTNTQDKQLQRIQYRNSYEEITAQYLLYFYLNEKYLQGLFKDNNASQAEVIGQIFDGISQPRKIPFMLTQSSKTSEIDYSEKTAPAARVRLETALEYARQKQAILDEQEAEEAYALEAEAMEDVALTDTDASVLSAVEGTDKYAAMEAFKAYQSENRLVTALEIKDIIAKHPEAYQKFVASVKEPLDELGITGKPMVVDMTLDDKNRILSSEVKMDISMQGLSASDIHISVLANFHNYGKAQVDQKIFKDAMKFEEISKENTLIGMFKPKKDQNLDEAESKSSNWSNEKRYQELARSLTQQNMSFIDAYTAAYRYAYLLEQGIDVEEGFEPEQLRNTARWNAIYFAQEYDLGVTPAESEEYENSPEEWFYYDESLSNDIWAIFEDVMNDKVYQNLYQQLRSKHKSDADLFSAIYKAIDERNEKKRLDVKTVDYPVGFDGFVKILGEIAIQDLKTQTVDQQKIDRLTEREMAWFEAEIYEQTYKQFLDR